MHAPKTIQDAYYFLNKLVKDKTTEEDSIRLVSYYFEQKSEVIESDERMNLVRELLLPHST